MSAPLNVRFREADFPRDRDFFRRIEFETTRASLSPEDRRLVDDSELRRALIETHDLLFEREGHRVFVVEADDGRPVGLLWFGLNRNLLTGRPEGWIYNVTVLPEYRSRGLGGRILDFAESLARAAGLDSIGLMVSAQNEAAIRLYRKQGYATTNHVMRKPVN